MQRGNIIFNEIEEENDEDFKQALVNSLIINHKKNENEEDDADLKLAIANSLKNDRQINNTNNFFTKRKIPVYLLCPFTGELMKEPVLLRTGYTFERAALATWFEVNNTCPMTGVQIPRKERAEFTPNTKLKQVIELYHKRPELFSVDSITITESNKDQSFGLNK